MAKVITICNNKGGTGKTTTAVNLAAALRLRGYDVLAVDFDGQANLTETFRVQARDGGTMYNAMKSPLYSDCVPVRVLSPDEQAGVLYVLPSSRDLSALEVELAQEPDRVTRLRGIIDVYRNAYDIIIIDTPPQMGLLAISTLYAADVVIIASQPEYLAVRGLVKLNEAITAVNANRTKPIDVQVLFTQYDTRKSLHRLAAEQIRGGFRTFDTVIRDNVALAEAPLNGTDIFRYAPRSNGAKDYDALTNELLNTVKVKHVRHGYK